MKAILKVFLLSLFFIGGVVMAGDKAWDKVFAKSDEVDVQKVK